MGAGESAEGWSAGASAGAATDVAAPAAAASSRGDRPPSRTRTPLVCQSKPSGQIVNLFPTAPSRFAPARFARVPGHDPDATGVNGAFFGPGRRRRRIPNRVLRPDRRAALWAASEDLARPWLPDSIWQPTSPDHRTTGVTGLLLL